MTQIQYPQIDIIPSFVVMDSETVVNHSSKNHSSDFCLVYPLSHENIFGTNKLSDELIRTADPWPARVTVWNTFSQMENVPLTVAPSFELVIKWNHGMKRHWCYIKRWISAKSLKSGRSSILVNFRQIRSMPLVSGSEHTNWWHIYWWMICISWQ